MTTACRIRYRVRHGGWHKPWMGRLLLSAEGTATVEFVLLFPVLLFLVLTLVQVTLLMVGNIFVHYAAFAATRAAVSQIPGDRSAVGGEPRNEVVASSRSPKFGAIERAAWFAVMPVSGQSGKADGGVDADAFVTALRSYLSNSGQGQPNWVDRLAAGRLRYAAAHTRVKLLRISVSDAGDVDFTEVPPSAAHLFGPLDPITVEVEHDFFLSVPYVWRMFAAEESGEEHGGSTPIRAQYTLSNEGVDPALPPEPALPRQDP